MVTESRRSLRSPRPCRIKCLGWLLLVGIGIVGVQNALWMTSDWKTMSIGFPDGTSPTKALTQKKKRFAYAFYATTSAYACGAFVQVAQLRDLGTPPSIDFVLLTYGEASTNPGIAEQASKMNIILKAVEHLPILGGNGVGKVHGRDRVQHNAYYTNVMVKLRVFQLYEYDRIVYMDTDMMVRQSLDHLFEDEALPFSTTTLAAAKVTNRMNTDPLRFCSCFMVIQPSIPIWIRIERYFHRSSSLVKSGPMYDMDLLNHEFQKEIILLPGSYGMLTAIWDNHNVTSAKSEVDAEIDDATTEWYQRILQGSPNWAPSHPRNTGSNVKSRQDLFQASRVLHFTPNKPMVERNMVNIQRNQPNADPQYYATFEKWYSLASYVCASFDSQTSNLHKYDKHRTHKFQRTNQFSDYFN